jgi:hypothetical protein
MIIHEESAIHLLYLTKYTILPPDKVHKGIYCEDKLDIEDGGCLCHRSANINNIGKFYRCR